MSPTPTPTPQVFITFSGRVLTPTGTGLRNAQVRIVEADGTIRKVMTSTLGYFSFENVAAGTTVQISIHSRLYRFEPVGLLITEGMPEPNFVGLE